MCFDILINIELYFYDWNVDNVLTSSVSIFLILADFELKQLVK